MHQLLDYSFVGSRVFNFYSQKSSQISRAKTVS